MRKSWEEMSEMEAEFEGGLQGPGPKLGIQSLPCATILFPAILIFYVYM